MPAIVAVCRLTLHLPVSHSLKDKRQVLRSLKTRLWNTYRVSVAETSARESWQSAELLVVFAASDSRYAQELLDKIVAYTEDYHLPLELLAAESELLHF